MSQRQLAALVENAPHDHRQHILDPSELRLRVERGIQADILSQSEQRGRSAELLGAEHLKSLRRVRANDLTAQSGLDIEQGGERHIGDAAMLCVPDFAGGRIAESGAQHTDGMGSVALDFEMDRRAAHDGYDSELDKLNCKEILIPMYGYNRTTKITTKPRKCRLQLI